MLYSLLLAGGKSSRMGQDKATLVYRGKTLLDHSLALLESTGADRILVSGNVPGYECIPDLVPGAGPLGGIQAALHSIAHSGGLDDSLLLVIPVDMPMLEPEVLGRLIAAIGDDDSCGYENEIFPCVFRASTSLADYLEALFRDGVEPGGKRSMKSLLSVFSGRTVTTEGLPEKTFLNLNRPEDLDALTRESS